MANFDQNKSVGAFQSVINAIASNDPKRIAKAEDDALTALECVGSMLNVMANYVYIRYPNPKASLYADDADLANAVYTVADVSSCIHTALVKASNARFELNRQSQTRRFALEKHPLED